MFLVRLFLRDPEVQQAFKDLANNNYNNTDGDTATYIFEKIRAKVPSVTKVRIAILYNYIPHATDSGIYSSIGPHVSRTLSFVRLSRISRLL